MNVVTFVLVGLLVACSFRKGYGVTNFIGPAPSGSVIANFEGAINATTLICNVTRGETQLDTFWNFANFRGVAGRQSLISLGSSQNLFVAEGLFLNELTVTSWTSEVDQVIVFCGTGGEPTQANVTLRIYRPPSLRDSFSVRITEGDFNVPIDLLQEPEAVPEPKFDWFVDGRQLRSGATTTYSSVTFDSVLRTDAGNYVVNATNYLLDNSSQPVGSDTGSFSLDVLYPPTFVTQSPTERYVLLGDPVSLVCGRGLDSNPHATITWTAPDNTIITMNMGRYTLDNGPEIVRLNFTDTIIGDNGRWTCVVAVTSDRYIVSGGILVSQDQANIGSVTQDIQVTVIAPPGHPGIPAVEKIGATWTHICWDPPLMADSPISRYQIIGREVGGQGVVTESTTTNATFFNITGLLPATTYSFTVVAISEGGDVIAVSPESPAIQDTTRFTVPEVHCFDPVSANGNISVRWSYIHTGGLDLTGVSAEYSFIEGVSMVTQPVPLDSLHATSVNVSGLVTGFMYTFRITAENSNGSNTASCRSTQHLIGVPREPQFGDVQPGSRAGEITLEIKTVASGVVDRDQTFRFIITPVLDGDILDPISYDKFDYISGMFELITVSGLEPGRSYTVSAYAMNVFGMSGLTNSPPVHAAAVAPVTPGNPPTRGSPSSINVGVLIGCIIGGLFTIVITFVILCIIILVLFLRKGARDKTDSEVVYEEPDLNLCRPRAKKDQDIELEECPAYGESKANQNVELKECPAYGIL